jgi:CsoR family transcriptional regulator, copper-sensing transcriptional repressor
MKAQTAKNCLNRLRRVEGQIRGVAKMIEEDRYCIEVITQLQAVKSALLRIEEEILKDHVAHCVASALKSGNANEQKNKIDELMAVITRAR